MSESISTDLDQFDQGIAFEALADSLNNEIARHLAALNAEPEGINAHLHDHAVNSLTEARQQLDPNNVAAIRLATLIMSAYRDKTLQRTPVA